MKTEHELPPPDPATRGRYDRFRNEVMAGGSVTESPVEADPPATLAGKLTGLVILGLIVLLAFVNTWMFIFVVGIIVSVFLHETGHFYLEVIRDVVAA